MKKTMTALVLCLLLLCMAACSNNSQSNSVQFSSNEEMLNHLKGMWVATDSTTENTYYIFQDNQLYITKDATYSAQVTKLLDGALQNGGLDALYVQDFKLVSDRMYLSDLTTTPNTVTLFPKNGEIEFYEGIDDKKSIIITEESVLLVTNDTENSTVMTKVAETADFSAEHFESLFNQILNSYAIPSKHFLIDTIEYGEMVKTTIPQFDWWSLTWSDDDLKVYAPDKALTTVDGSSLLISKENLTFAYKISAPTGFVGKDHKQSLVITYSPQEGSIQVLETNNPSMNLYSLIKYGLYAIQNVPGAYTDPIELANDMDAKGRKVSSDYSSEIVMTANGITYELSTTEAGSATLGEFNIKVNEAISLNTILEGATESTETETSPTQSDALEHLLDLSKAWKVDFVCEETEGTFHYAFLEDGSCYLVMSDGLSPWGGGKGTYTLNGTCIIFSISMDGGRFDYSYAFDQQTNTLTHISGTPIFSGLAATGDKYKLEEDDANTVSKIKEMAQDFIDSYTDDGDI